MQDAFFEDRLNKKSKTKIYKKNIKKAAQGLTSCPMCSMMVM